MTSLARSSNPSNPTSAADTLATVLRNLNYSPQAVGECLAHYLDNDCMLDCPSVEPEDLEPLEQVIRLFDADASTWGPEADDAQWICFDAVDRVARPISDDNESVLELVESAAHTVEDEAWAMLQFNGQGDGSEPLPPADRFYALFRQGGAAARAEDEMRRLGIMSLGLAQRIADGRDIANLD